MSPCSIVETPPSTTLGEEFCPSSHLALVLFPHLVSSVSQGVVFGPLPFPFFCPLSLSKLSQSQVSINHLNIKDSQLYTHECLFWIPFTYFHRPLSIVYVTQCASIKINLIFSLLEQFLFMLSLILITPGNTKMKYH